MDIHEFRRQIDDFMGKHPQSPLAYGQQDHFRGLNYYEPDPAYVLEAAVVAFPENEPPLRMQTSSGDERLFRRLAELRFAVGDRPVALTLYSDPSGEELFLPFKDQTNGEETYGAGRYLDNNRPGLAWLNSSRMEIDFNFCYNPYCAYDAGYSCPLPPRENWLPVRIEAGEKGFG